MSAPCRGWQWVACLCPHSSSSIFAVPFISHQPPLASPTIVIQNCNTSAYGSTCSTSFSASLYKIMSLSPCHLTPKLDLPQFIFFFSSPSKRILLRRLLISVGRELIALAIGFLAVILARIAVRCGFFLMVSQTLKFVSCAFAAPPWSVSLIPRSERWQPYLWQFLKT